MSRDMKHVKRTPAKKSAGGTLVGMFIGLVLGVGVAAGIVWYMNRAPLPFVDKVQPSAKPEAKGGHEGKVAQGESATEPRMLPGKPGDPVPEKRFQFYDILPGKADAVPDRAAADKPQPKKEDAKKEEAKKDEPRDSKTPMFLQAGSFSSPEDADNQRAKLAFMGYESVVQQVMIQDKTFYRVRVGPYSRTDDMNRVRAELAKSGIDAQLSK